MQHRLALAAATLLVIAGIVGTAISRANIAARDPRYERPAADHAGALLALPDFVRGVRRYR